MELSLKLRLFAAFDRRRRDIRGDENYGKMVVFLKREKLSHVVKRQYEACVDAVGGGAEFSKCLLLKVIPCF